MTNLYLDTQSKLETFCSLAITHGHMAVDLEFIPENSYYPELALIQVAVDDQCHLVDPLSRLDLTPLFELVSNETILKIVHAGSQDMGIFYHLTEQLPQNVFDTQIAGAFIGLGHQVSYQSMVSQLLDVQIKKGQSYTNWLARPLSQKQEVYAIEDVKYLFAAYQKTMAALEEKGRLDWITQELRVYQNHGFYETDRNKAYTRVKKHNKLGAGKQHILKALAAWREDAARERNKPRKRIMGDHVLVSLAERTPLSMHDMRSVRGIDHLPKKTLSALLDVIRSAHEAGASPRTGPQRPDLQGINPKPLIDFTMFCLKSFCDAENLSAAYVASRSDIEDLIFDYLSGNFSPDNHIVLQGWKKSCIGADLLACIAGKKAAKIDPDGHNIVFVDV